MKREPITLHASCAAKQQAGVLLVGPSGAGKSDLLLRLIDRGFALVADDQVQVDGLLASAPEPLVGLVEARGLGIIRLPCVPSVLLGLVVRLEQPVRLPIPLRYELIDLPVVSIDPRSASAALLVELALDGVQGRTSFLTGAFG